MRVEEERVAAFLEGLAGLDTILTPKAKFYYYDPARDVPHDRRQPFATIVTADDYDGASDLERRGAYRVNAGVERETYRALFGPEPEWSRDGPVRTGHDFTALDTFLPHPVYAPMSWICIIDPSEASWPALRERLREAHAKARRAHERTRPPPP